jgi:hypothetical protein
VIGGDGDCPFASIPNTDGKARLTLLLKNGHCIDELEYCDCPLRNGDIDESDAHCNVAEFRQRRKDGLWEVSVPIAEISAILHGPFGPLQEDE